MREWSPVPEYEPQFLLELLDSSGNEATGGRVRKFTLGVSEQPQCRTVLHNAAKTYLHIQVSKLRDLTLVLNSQIQS
jgi:hypothetical protein